MKNPVSEPEQLVRTQKTKASSSELPRRSHLAGGTQDPTERIPEMRKNLTVHVYAAAGTAPAFGMNKEPSVEEIG